ncbi:cupin domain-containing protein [Roseovarius aquimarinus]|uniref:Cupin domain-containing protein n=1 Tax=Roseovarius aquimarinus TaxID=1229156 RepID=A0ABW7I7K3_9RHOB
MSQETFRIDPAPPMQPSSLTGADAFTTDDRSEGNHTHFETADESISVGTWECAPCREVVASWPVHEMMTVVEGAVTLTHEDGRSESFGPGDTFYIAKGQHVVWEITQKLRKMYMIVA